MTPKTGRTRELLKALSAGLDAVTPARLYIVAVITVLIVLHGVVPHRFQVDGTTVALLAILVVITLVPILKSASLPGGGGLDFREDLDLLQRESQLAEEEQERRPPAILSTNFDPMIEEGQRGQLLRERSADAIVTEVLQEAARSPKVGLMLLSAELERAVHTLLMATGWAQLQPRFTLRVGIERLVEIGVLTHSAASALAVYQSVRNEIIHGGRMASDDEVLRALDAAIPLLRAVLAVPMEKNFVSHPGVDIFSDSAASNLIIDAKGLILETVSPGGVSITCRIFPTTKTDYELGKQVSWEWGPRQWGEAWYRDPDSGEVRQAWGGSMEFRGRHLDEI